MKNTYNDVIDILEQLESDRFISGDYATSKGVNLCIGTLIDAQARLEYEKTADAYMHMYTALQVAHYYIFTL